MNSLTSSLTHSSCTYTNTIHPSPPTHSHSQPSFPTHSHSPPSSPSPLIRTHHPPLLPHSFTLTTLLSFPTPVTHSPIAAYSIQVTIHHHSVVHYGNYEDIRGYKQTYIHTSTAFHYTLHISLHLSTTSFSNSPNTSLISPLHAPSTCKHSPSQNSWSREFSWYSSTGKAACVNKFLLIMTLRFHVAGESTPPLLVGGNRQKHGKYHRSVGWNFRELKMGCARFEAIFHSLYIVWIRVSE